MLFLAPRTSYLAPSSILGMTKREIDRKFDEQHGIPKNLCDRAGKQMVGSKNNLTIRSLEVGIEKLEKPSVSQQGISEASLHESNHCWPSVSFLSVGYPQFNRRIAASYRLRASGEDELLRFGTAQIDTNQGSEVLLKDGVVGATVKQSVAKPSVARTGNAYGGYWPPTSQCTAKRRDGMFRSMRDVGDDYRPLAPPRMISSGWGTEDRTQSFGSNSEASTAAAKSLRESALAKIRVPSGLHATYLPEYLSSSSGGNCVRFLLNCCMSTIVLLKTRRSHPLA